MTFKEQFDRDYPKLKNKDVTRFGCPFDYGYEASHSCKDPTCRNRQHCLECWNRKMPSLKNATIAFGNQKVDVSYSGREPIEYVDTAEFANTEPHILDSGERRHFKSGAVRDIQEGKGRCDLMPLKVVGLAMRDEMFTKLGMFLDTGDTKHLCHCLGHFSKNWDDGKTKPDRDAIFNQRATTMYLEVAKHFEEGAKKYGENNWQKGLPVHCYIDSAVRHYLKWLRGDKDEPHDRAFVWNLLCCIWEADFSPRAKKENATAITLYADNTPIEHIPSDLVRYGDCPPGLFETDEGVFVKTEIEDAEKYGAYIAIHVNTGRTRLFDNDILVRPLDGPSQMGCGNE